MLTILNLIKNVVYTTTAADIGFEIYADPNIKLLGPFMDENAGADMLRVKNMVYVPT